MSDQSDNPIERLDDVLKRLSAVQIRYVIARIEGKTQQDAAKACRLGESTYYSWANRGDVDEAIRLIALDGVVTAREVLRRNVATAALELADQLHSKRSMDRYRAAVEILDRVLGKATQPVSGADGGPVEIVVRYAND